MNHESSNIRIQYKYSEEGNDILICHRTCQHETLVVKCSAFAKGSKGVLGSSIFQIDNISHGKFTTYWLSFTHWLWRYRFTDCVFAKYQF